MKSQLCKAVKEVKNFHAQRICVPGKWIVWRDDEGVHWKILK